MTLGFRLRLHGWQLAQAAYIVTALVLLKGHERLSRSRV